MSDAKETEDKSGTQGHLENVRASLKRSSLAPLLAEAEEKVGVPMETLALGVCAVLAVLVFIGGASASLVIHTVSLAYPIMATVKCIEGSAKWNALSAEEWAVYWMLLCLFNAGEGTFVSHLLHWIPFYYPLKLAFFVGCLWPGTNVLRNIVDKVVPMLSSHVDTLESNMDSAGKKKD